MNIYIGADHRGFKLKEQIKTILLNEGYQVFDLGAATYDSEDDFPVYGNLVATEVKKNLEIAKGILICGSGFGMEIVANKIRGIRAVLPQSPDHAYQARHDDDANILVLPANFVDEEVALKIVRVFLSTPFAREERYLRRLEEISKIEEA
jgi:ribose 5-phosphate isomerase B